MFKIITPDIQHRYESSSESDDTPDLCGYFGRACRQMDREEGANRALCLRCPLASFAASLDNNKVNPYNADTHI